MTDEKYYLALKRLTSMPEWRLYEEFLGELEKETYERFLLSTAEHLNYWKGSAITIREIKARPIKLISEVEEIHKRRNQK